MSSREQQESYRRILHGMQHAFVEKGAGTTANGSTAPTRSLRDRHSASRNGACKLPVRVSNRDAQSYGPPK